jgi:hypothetical protein
MTSSPGRLRNGPPAARLAACRNALIRVRPFHIRRPERPQVGSEAMIKSITFEHKGHKLEARAEATENEIQVRVFENDKQTTPAVYRVTIETVFDRKITGFPLNFVDALLETAREDIEEERMPILTEKSN